MQTEAQVADSALTNIRKRNTDEESGGGEEARKETTYGLGGAYMDMAGVNGHGNPHLQHANLPPAMRHFRNVAGKPAILALSAFSTGACFLGIVNVGLISSELLPTVAPPAFFYSGFCQIVAGILAFANNDNFTGVAASSYGAFYLAFGAYMVFWTQGFFGPISIIQLQHGLGAMLFGYIIFNTYIYIASFMLTLGLMIMFFFVEMSLILSMASLYGKISTVPGGVFSILLAATGWYNAATILFEDMFGRPILFNPLMTDIYMWLKGRRRTMSST
ncbi:hypothetical protein GAYE_SCF66G6822 [Galdieria yellowstonensis]|uniref:Acetate transporter n=1 Tax=Galdieria yellowstonensis TaxID=3028027 RepID=A0AAV9IND6_9RHOD|nr:hypothetical protein GAYE_SCF66G6822 [Galdieria yellowstonensis]